MRVVQKFFNTVFKVAEKEKTVFIRGEQIVKVESFTTEKRLIFYLADGSQYTFTGEGADLLKKLIEEDVRKG